MPSSSPPPQTPTLQHQNALDDSSDSDASQVTLQQRRSPLPPASRPSATRSPAPGGDSSSSSTVTTSTLNYSRPTAPQTRTHDLPFRADDYATQSEVGARLGHRPRQRSQGYFEPSLPTSMSSNMLPHTSSLTASQIAAQAAMHSQTAQHNRKRSTTIPERGSNQGLSDQGQRQPTSPPPVPGSAHTVTFKTNGMTYQNGILGTNRMAATTAANAAFPRSPLHSPGLQNQPQEHGSPKPSSTPELPYAQKPAKEKSKMKLFSKPKNINITKNQEFDKKNQPLPSPGKIGIGIHSSQTLKNMMMNQSTTSLVDTNMSSSSSLYSSANASTSTLVPRTSDTYQPYEREKEKHKHHFLSRQKNKLKDKDDHHLPLSSAMSNSRPVDPAAPQPLYSFAAPASPGHASTFANSVTGLDLRHGGRHLRQKKKEEKNAAAYLDVGLDPPFRERNQSFSTERSDWLPAGSLGSTPGTTIGQSPGTALAYGNDTMLSLGNSFGLNGLSPDDAWPLLKARLLHIFEGEDPRPPVEDFNALVTIYIKRCIQKRSPILLVEDLDELLTTGFQSLDQTLRHIPDDRLIPHLVEMWLVVFTTILPFLQAVFLPLDLEFKGKGIMSSSAAADFWGVLLPDEMNTRSPENKNIPILGELEVRRITLLTFRDTVILPRFETLMALFSRLSLENLNAGLESPTPIPERPGTSGSQSMTLNDPNSLGSSSGGYLESTTTLTSSSSRSRATSNTSAGSFSAHSVHSNPTTNSLLHPYSNQHLPNSVRSQPMDSAKVTETVGRMLQCVSVLVSLQSADESQEKMGKMVRELKYNWLGRGRTGRQRQGFVGPKRGGILNLGIVEGVAV